MLLTGLCIGSFLNVFGLRLLSEESIAYPPSKCPKCQTPINWFDNLPVISYIILGGKCRKCKEHISLQYPAVEAFTGLLYVALYLAFGFSLQTLVLIILCSTLIVIAITDFKDQCVYDINSLPLIPLGLIYNFFNIGHNSIKDITIPLEGISSSIVLHDVFISALIGAVLGLVFFEIICLIGYVFVGQRAFGFGDSLISAGLGAWFGWKLLLVIFVLSFIVQAIAGIPIVLWNMYKNREYKSIACLFGMFSSVLIPYIAQKTGFSNTLSGALISSISALILVLVCTIPVLKAAKERQSYTFLPFGPALIFGAFVVIFYGEAILKLYS